MKYQSTKTTFIVDDDPFWTAILSSMLSDLGFDDIVTFNNGRECLANLHLYPKLVFLDYQMDNEDGLEVLQQINNDYPTVGVIFCIAHENLGIAVNAMKQGSLDFFIKSNCTPSVLASMIEEISKKQHFEEKIL